MHTSNTIVKNNHCNLRCPALFIKQSILPYFSTVLSITFCVYTKVHYNYIHCKRLGVYNNNNFWWFEIDVKFQISPPVKQQKSSYSVFEPTKLWDSYRELDFFPIQCFIFGYYIKIFCICFLSYYSHINLDLFFFSDVTLNKRGYPGPRGVHLAF